MLICFICEWFAWFCVLVCLLGLLVVWVELGVVAVLGACGVV